MVATDELPSEEISRRLQSLRYDLRNRVPVRGRRKISIAYIARMAGLHRATLYRVMHGRVSEKSRASLSPLLITHAGEGLLPRPRDPLPPPQDKLVRATDWNEWSRCRTCGGRQFSPVIMNEAKWFFCDGCLPQEQYPTLGARSVGLTDPIMSQKGMQLVPRPLHDKPLVLASDFDFSR